MRLKGPCFYEDHRFNSCVTFAANIDLVAAPKFTAADIVKIHHIKTGRVKNETEDNAENKVDPKTGGGANAAKVRSGNGKAGS